MRERSAVFETELAAISERHREEVEEEVVMKEDVSTVMVTET